MTREESIKKIKEAMPTMGKETKEAVQALVPELMESEDERIRKMLIEKVEKWHEKALENNMVEDIKASADIITYLEKQKDLDKMIVVFPKVWDKAIADAYENGEKDGEKQKETGIRWFKSDNVENPDKPYIDKVGMFYTTDGRMCYASEIENQKEQKAAEQVEINKSLNDVVVTELAKYSGENYWKSPWAIDSTGFRYPLHFAKLGAKWQEEQKSMNDKVFEEWIDDWWKHNKVNNPDSYDKGDEIQFDEKGFKNFCRGIRNMYQQEPAWSEDDENKLDNICDYIAGKFNLGDIAKKDAISFLKSLPQRFNLQSKVEWSEEDEKNRCPLNTKEIKVGDIITYFRNGKKGIMLVSSFDSGIYPRCKWGITHIDGTAYGDWVPSSGPYYTATEKEKQQLYDTMPIEVKDWLKSLPERFVLQPKQEWSEKDEEALREVKLNFELNHDDMTSALVDFYEKFFNKIKFLRPQPKQEWSEEDNRLINTSISFLKDFADKGYENAVECIDYLKSLCPSWKPTEEQMEALRLSFEDAFDDAGDCYRYRELKSLYEQLKKLM